MSEPKIKTRRVAVIGAGLAGLAAATRLAHAGCEVTVFEKNERPGGTLNVFAKDGFTWDTLPAELLTPAKLRSFFEKIGCKLEDHLTLVPLEPACRYRWNDGTSIDENAEFWRIPDVAGFLDYAAGFEEFMDALASGSFFDPANLLRRETLSRMLTFPRLADPRSLAQVVRHHFEDPYLRQLFSQFAAHAGSSPFLSPGALSVIAHRRAMEGSWYVKDGLHRIADALARLAEGFGAKLLLNTCVTGLSRAGHGHAIALDGKWEAFDAVICNKDPLLAYQNLLSREHASWFKEKFLHERDTSLSAFILLLGVDRQYDGLAHRNVFFSQNQKAEFEQLFHHRQPVAEPTISVTVSSRIDPAHAPSGCDNLLVAVSAPALRSHMRWSETAPSYSEGILDLLEQSGFPDLRSHIVVKEWITPGDFRRHYSAHGGNLHGFAAHGRLRALQRPPLKPFGMENFQFATGALPPGCGISQIILGGDIAAQRLLG